jgi:hypothetical protein
MSIVQVFRFRYLDRRSAQWIVADDFATQRAIEQVGGEILYESAREVDAGQVSYAGILKRD